MVIVYANKNKAMKIDFFEDRKVSPAVGGKNTVLEIDETRNQKLSVRECLYPFPKFGQVLFVYRFSDVERGSFKILGNDSGTIAVIP